MGDNKGKALNILEEAFTVYSQEEHAINTNNGILNEEYLKYHKKALLKKSIGYLAEELVKHRQGFPKDDISDVELKTDFVVLKRKEYDKLMNLIQNI